VTQADLLRGLLDLARQEDLLRGENLEAFVRALCERAALVLDERVRTAEEENAWRRESMEGLQERVRGLEAENAWQRETAAALQAVVRQLGEEKASLEGERQKATRAHEELLAHHRDVVQQVIREILGVSSLSFVRAREARRRLLALAELLRPEAG